jgi:hypothetical protein
MHMSKGIRCQEFVPEFGIYSIDEIIFCLDGLEHRLENI